MNKKLPSRSNIFSKSKNNMPKSIKSLILSVIMLSAFSLKSQNVLNTLCTATVSAVASQSTICEGLTNTLTATGTTSYTWSTGATTASITVSPTVATVYTVTGSDALGCLSTYTVTFNVNPKPPVNAVASPTAICSGGTSTLTASGANTYTWNPLFVGAVNIVSRTVTSNFTVTGTSALGCKASKVIRLTVNALPSIAIASSPSVICSGSSSTLTATGATSYTWNTTATTNSISVSPVSTTVYTVSGKNAAGCMNTKTVSLTVNAKPTLSVTASGSICAGSSISLTANGASTYTWNPGALTGSLVTVSPSSSTVYSVTGKSASGCVSSPASLSSITVYTYTPISVNSGSICSGKSFTIVPSGAITYTYSSGSNIVSPSSTTNYTVNGTYANGCTNSAISSVTVNAGLPISVNSGSICSGKSFTMIPSGAVTYTYSSGSNIVSPTSTTNYTINGTDVNGCNNTAISSVTVNATPSISLNTGGICSGGSFTFTPTGAITYTYSSGSAIVSPLVNTTYTVTGANAQGCIGSAVSTVSVSSALIFSVNSGSICTGNSFTMIPSGAVSYTYSSGSAVVTPITSTVYTITGVSAQGCLGTITSSVTVNTLPTITVNSGSICSGDSFTLSPTGASTYTYSSGSNIVTPSASDVYTITGTSAQGCTGIVTSSVTVNALPTIAVNSGSICSGDSFTLSPTGALTYTYSSGSNVVNPIATSDYTVSGTNSLGCSANTVSSVTVNTLPTITVNSGAICSGESFTLSPTGAFTYTYSSGSSIVTPTTTTDYTVTGTDANGCTNSVGAVSSIIVNSSPILSVNDGTICPGETFTILPLGALTYTYSGGSSVVTATVSSSYIVTGTDANGCIGATISSLFVNALPAVTANATQTAICEGDALTLTGGGAVTYTWSGSVVDGVAFFPRTTDTYTVVGTDANGCQNTAVNTVTVNPLPSVTFSLIPSPICALTSTVALSATPIGGTFTGTDVVGSDFIPLTANTYTLSYTYVDANSCSATTSQNVVVNSCTGIEELTNNNVIIYPNPVKNLVHVLVNANYLNTANIELFDAIGSLVYQQKVTNEDSVLNLDLLANGVYLIKITSNNTNVVKRIIKN